MTSRTIQTTTGNQILYKVIKDGYKTVTQTINVTDILPTRTSYDLVPSSIVHGNELNYTIDTNHDYPPIITFNSNVETADGEEITTSKYVFAPYGKEYVVVDDNEKDNFTTIGNVKVDENGVVNNFSSRNAIVLNNILETSTPWEIQLKFKPSNVLTRQKLNGCVNSVDYNFPTIEFGRDGVAKFRMDVSSNGTSWNIGDVIGTYTLLANTWYWVRFGWTGSEYYLDYSTDGESFIRDITVSSSVSAYRSNYYMGIGNDMWASSYQAPFLGSIDLSESYIKANNNVWWKPTFSKFVSNYSVIGELKIYNGITQQAFTSANYVNSIPQSFTQVSPTESNWEWVFKIEQYATSSSRQVLYSQGRSYESSLYIDTSNKIGLSINNTTNSTYVVSMAGSTVLVSGNSYWIKARFTGSSYQLLLSTDGKTWRSEASTSSTTKLAASSNENWHIGYNYHSNSSYHYLLQSKLNLRESYIKVNGEYWWRGIQIDSNTIIPGILDVNYFDTGDEVTLKLYDVETNDRTLVINDTRNVDVSGKKFVQYDGDILIPEHGLSVYDEDNYTWSKYRIITLNVNDESTSIYTEGDIE